ncbi:hypothetical protein JCGZ_26372 [Jatropha curcas]|uniref:DUF3444 domain-containing protein n=1 Tax=Jatropha curcas TaxID=180498 RepID=A0A067JF49_JATCU|nr:hypothetical protein JCGZ_26372 [Jatropha curcas]
MLEALGEKEVAEQMMICNDFANAREHFLRLHQHFPVNENIDSMLSLCDILTAARVELPGCGIDHYWVLQCRESTSDSCYKIYPLKGEIWTTYKGWNTKWKTVDYKSYQCQIVQIVSEFSEGDEITVSRLEKLKVA